MLLLGAFTYYTITLLAWCAAEHARRQRQQLSATDWFQQQQQIFQRREQKQLQARLAYDELYDRGIADGADHSSNVNASNIGFDGAYIEPVNFVTLGRDLVHPQLRHVIRIGILLTILGVCAIYLDLIGHLMVDVLDPDRSGRYAPFAWWTWTQRYGTGISRFSRMRSALGVSDFPCRVRCIGQTSLSCALH
jgi:hypothetical protein